MTVRFRVFEKAYGINSCIFWHQPLRSWMRLQLLIYPFIHSSHAFWILYRWKLSRYNVLQSSGCGWGGFLSRFLPPDAFVTNSQLNKTSSWPITISPIARWRMVPAQPSLNGPCWVSSLWFALLGLCITLFLIISVVDSANLVATWCCEEENVAYQPVSARITFGASHEMWF